MRARCACDAGQAPECRHAARGGHARSESTWWSGSSAAGSEIERAVEEQRAATGIASAGGGPRRRHAGQIGRSRPLTCGRAQGPLDAAHERQILDVRCRRRTWSLFGTSSRPYPTGTRSGAAASRRPVRSDPHPGWRRLRGPRGRGRFFERWFGTWDEIRMTPERFIEDGDRVLALMVIEGRGKGSGCRW